MTIFFAAGMFGLTCLPLPADREGQALESAHNLGSGIIVRSELLELWLPETLTKLAQRPSQALGLRSHEELQRYLEAEGRKDVWYALTTRAHQVNGDFVDITVIRWPYSEPLQFAELREILARAGGDPANDSDAGGPPAAVRILQQDELVREPRQVMAELLGHRSSAADHER